MMASVGVVAHHSRLEIGERLADQVNAEFMTVDKGDIGAGRNHEAAWKWLEGGDAKWGVVLEDDAKPVVSFRKQLDLALAAAPFPIVSLYLGRARPPHWQNSIASVIASPASWLLADELLHHVGVAIPTVLIGTMLDAISADSDYVWGKIPIDEAIGRWVRKDGSTVA
jgi:hypothetical protein